MAETCDLTINAGATWLVTLMLKDESGNPIDITGAEGRSQIRKTAKSADVLASPKVEVVDAVTGKLEISLTADETSALPTTGTNHLQMDSWVYDVVLTYLGGTVERIINGSVRVSPEVTR